MNRLTTGISGLDLVLDGGLQRGTAVILAGAPGTGKTILTQQICFTNAMPGSKSVYYSTMSEPHAKLVKNLEQFSFFDAKVLDSRVELIHLGDFLRPARQSGLEHLVSEIVRKAIEEEPVLVAIDSTKMLRDLAGERELRSALYDLTSRLAHTDTVLLMAGEYTTEELQSGIEFSLADGIIQLEAREPVDRRSLRVMKMRGGLSLPGRHTFEINLGGIEVFPRIETIPQEEGPPSVRRTRSGIPGLDELMGGGIKQGEATMVLGASGIGKTIFGLRWIAEAVGQGERCLYITFQDTPEQLLSTAAGFGWDLLNAAASGQLALRHVPMGRLDLDVLASTVRAELARHPIARVVIDGLDEMVFANRETERFPAFKRSLVGLIRLAGVSLLVTSETTAHSLATKSPTGLIFLFDNVIGLHYLEQGSQIGRGLNIVKMRNSQHAATLNSWTINERGVEVGPALKDVTGILGWSALRVPEPRPVTSEFDTTVLHGPALIQVAGVKRYHGKCQIAVTGWGPGNVTTLNTGLLPGGTWTRLRLRLPEILVDHKGDRREDEARACGMDGCADGRRGALPGGRARRHRNDTSGRHRGGPRHGVLHCLL